jgi:small conductance mechanosensitive channel
MIDINAWIASLDSSMLNISIASLYIMCGFLAGRFLGKFFGKVVKNMNIGEMTKKLGVSKPEVLVENGVSYLIYIIAIVLALQRIGMPSYINIIIVVLVAILITTLIFLSLKEFLPNLVVGSYLRAIEHLRPKDKVKLEGIRGVVKKIGLFETEVVTPDKDIVFFPNSYFAKRIKLQLTTINSRKKHK